MRMTFVGGPDNSLSGCRGHKRRGGELPRFYPWPTSLALPRSRFGLVFALSGLSPVQKSITCSAASVGTTKILPSPMRPVRATSTIFLQDFFDPIVVDPQRDFDLGQKGQRVLAVAVLVEIAFLPAVAFDFAHAAGFQRGPLEAFQHLLGQKGFDDGDDLFHAGTLLTLAQTVCCLAASTRPADALTEEVFAEQVQGRRGVHFHVAVDLASGRPAAWCLRCRRRPSRTSVACVP